MWIVVLVNLMTFALASKETSFIDLPRDVVRMIPMERSDVCKYFQTFTHVKKSPINPTTFFNIISRGDLTPLEDLILKRVTGGEAASANILKFMKKVEGLEYNVHRALQIGRVFRVVPHCDISRPLVSYNHKAAVHAILSLYFGIGSFQYLTEEEKNMFKAVCGLYCGSFLKMIKEKAFMFFALPETESVFHLYGKGSNIDDDWVVEHLVTTDISNGGRRSAVGLFGSVFHLFRKHYYTALQNHQPITKRLIDILVAVWSVEEVKEDVDNILRMFRVTREQVDFCLNGDYADLRHRSVCYRKDANGFVRYAPFESKILLFVRHWSDFVQLPHYTEYLYCWSAPCLYEVFMKTSPEEWRRFMIGCEGLANTILVVLEKMKAFTWRSESELVPEQSKLITLLGWLFQAQSEQEKTRTYTRLLLIMEQFGVDVIKRFASSGLKEIGDMQAIFGLEKSITFEKLENPRTLPKLFRATTSKSFLKDNQTYRRILEKFARVNLGINNLSRLLDIFDDTTLNSPPSKSVKLKYHEQDYTIMLPEVISGKDLYAIIGVTMKVAAKHAISLEVFNEDQLELKPVRVSDESVQLTDTLWIDGSLKFD